MEEDPEMFVDLDVPVEPEFIEKDSEDDVQTSLVYMILLSALALLGIMVIFVFALAAASSGGHEKQSAGYSFEPITDHRYHARENYSGRAERNPRDTGGPKRSKHQTLVCVFEYIGENLWDKNYECTDYVLIRIFSIEMKATGKEFAFRTNLNEFKEGYDHTKSQSLEISFATNFAKARRQYHYATWYIGMWGAMYTRMRSITTPKKIGENIRKYINNEMQRDDLNKTYFQGLAIVNTLPPDNPQRYLLEEEKEIGEGGLKDLLVPTGWRFLHTIIPFTDHIQYWNAYLYHSLKHADIAGISTTHTMHLPRAAVPNLTQLEVFRPPNPNYHDTIHINMEKLVKEFSSWAKDLERESLCFSVTTAVNSMYGIPKSGWHFAKHNESYLTRMSRNALHQESIRKKIDFYKSRQYQSYLSRTGDEFHVFDLSDTIRSKVHRLLRLSYKKRCVLMEDLGEDSFSMNLGNFTVESYSFLKAITEEMRYLYGPLYSSR
ncbi:uncharacterized protein LOC144129564 [Amblyomma americanum]